MQTEPLAGISGLVTIREAARLLGLHPWQVRYFIHQRRVPVTVVSKTWLLRLRDLEGLRSREAE